MSDEEQLLKVDAIGCARASKKRREALLDEFERSGTSAAQFAALTGVKYPTFFSRVQKRRRKQDNSAEWRLRCAGWMQWRHRRVEAAVPGTSGGRGMGGAGLCVHLPCEARAQLAAALLRALAREGLGC